ncbi:transposase [Streptomyces sp. NBC_01201]|uniref:Transposase n=1 Tax=Streptomyces glycanivorans TaxID=3033808 RepID=A0ABY9J3E7_9ACTN|nr:MULTISPECIES: transposase [unclassified Streptomyces]WLQ62362.1 transposase [Streptomyces sp. Alt3]WSQ75869.1 transposase [Streptomyces sp. NBC_01213]WSQ83116.1 transposase [Streptomyces sp. NBC_01212]WSR46450.1 transposase [Streptomyces sp. NBC_01201]
MSVRLVITDAVWDRIEPLMPADPSRGRRRADQRRTLEAIAWKYRTCSSWRDLPKGCPAISGGSARGVRCGASQGGGTPAYWMYSGVPTTRRGAVAVVVRPPGISGQPLASSGPFRPLTSA